MTSKKIICLFIVLMFIAAVISGCKKEEEPTEISTYIVSTEANTELTTMSPQKQEYTIEQMSPKSIDAKLPEGALLSCADIADKSLYTLSEDEMLLDGTSAVAAYGNKKAQYYELESGIVLAVFLNDSKEIELTACYNADGKIIYLANIDTSWYFTDETKVDYVAYTFSTDSKSKVVSFYEPDGSRFAIYAANAYYDNNLNIMSNTEGINLLKRIGDSTELK